MFFAFILITASLLIWSIKKDGAYDFLENSFENITTPSMDELIEQRGYLQFDFKETSYFYIANQYSLVNHNIENTEDVKVLIRLFSPLKFQKIEDLDKRTEDLYRKRIKYFVMPEDNKKNEIDAFFIITDKIILYGTNFYKVMEESEIDVSLFKGIIGEENLVMIDGELYHDLYLIDSREEDPNEQYASILKSCKGGKIPTEDKQSNFGLNYKYRKMDEEGAISIKIDDEWHIYATEEGMTYFMNGVSNIPLPLGVLEEPPELIVESNIENLPSFITVKSRSYEWKYLSDENNEKESEIQLKTVKGGNPLTEIVEKNTVYNAGREGYLLKFGEYLPDEVQIRRWPIEYVGREEKELEGETVVVDLNNFKSYIMNTEVDKVYVYELTATWESVGIAKYVFNITPNGGM